MQGITQPCPAVAAMKRWFRPCTVVASSALRRHATGEWQPECPGVVVHRSPIVVLVLSSCIRLALHSRQKVLSAARSWALGERRVAGQPCSRQASGHPAYRNNRAWGRIGSVPSVWVSTPRCRSPLLVSAVLNNWSQGVRASLISSRCQN